jgi:hypothetical protein
MYLVTVQHVHTPTVEILTSLTVSAPFTTYPKYPHEPSIILFVECQMCFPWSMIMTTSLRLKPIFENLVRYLTKTTSPHRPPFLDVSALRLTSNYILFHILSSCWLMYRWISTFLVGICRCEVSVYNTN